MQKGIESVLTTLLTASAVTIAGTLVYREFNPRSDRPNPTTDRRPEFVEDWSQLAGAGIRTGPTNAPVTILEFSDFECPFCQRFHATVRTIQDRFGDRVAHVFVHFPLPSHRFARPAARAAECANDQGAFARFSDVLFEKQDSLGFKSWTSYAVEAGVPDTVQFNRCNAETDSVTRIEAGLLAGERVGVRGTPTVIVNGWRLPGAPGESTLSAMVADFLAGKQPSLAGSSKGTE